MLKLNNKILFWFRLSALLVVVFFLISDLVLTIINPAGINADLGYAERVSNYYAFFTTQSNYIVAAYFLGYLFESKFRNTRPSDVIKLAVVTYITVTMLVFWFGIFTNTQTNTSYSSYEWISTIILHLVIPFCMILSYILTAGESQYNIRNHYKLSLWLILAYPVLYFVVILIRGIFRQMDHRPEGTWFPYFFLNIYQPNGILILALIFICILVLFVGLQYIYLWINNMLFRRNKGETLNTTVNKKVFGINTKPLPIKNEKVFIPATLINLNKSYVKKIADSKNEKNVK
ncbi:Pr6Pr family membrane protein [Spiroplasma chrysopicola]|uniref:Transmembrane protein n=1 Tax=Spiroplasma chrysopicola DF-1 TaxID=1276227 RepID=R4UFA8_9MOLU|nr:Pr6Pr family membrane protein [Spiroplasma chrysopicola]AGM24820.1 hypothetical protein SCHRY_v1c02350 [Spiroplasma chrysopicola DF-1]